ncbi:MAG TPA: EthD family reductase [Anaerolineae bacterium]|nr:EthD family reductase [Anaerolineae bacterium]
MIKLIALYKKPADVEAFEEHYANVHLPLIERIPGLRKTELSRITGAPRGEAPFYLMYEMYFDDMEAYNRAMGSEENRAAGKDLMSFAKDIVMLMIADAYEDEVRQ